MSTVTILGAGAMGSALATPFSAAGHTVRLWGTHLDEERIDALERGDGHPGTGVVLPHGVSLFRSPALLEAIAGSDTVVIAVSSVGVLPVASAAAPAIDDQLLLLASKGFHRRADGSIHLMPHAVRDALASPDRTIVGVGGPCKADEVAAGRITATLYASRDRDAAQRAAHLARTDAYRIEVSADEVGLEVCAPMKNVYAMALGYADGLEERTGHRWHNFKSALFAAAVREMSTLSARLGGETATAFGLAGVGDLEVTALSGRNKVFGQRVGAGDSVADARAFMDAAGLTVEGLSACGLAQSLAASVEATAGDLPLLQAIGDVLEGAEPQSTLERALGV